MDPKYFIDCAEIKEFIADHADTLNFEKYFEEEENEYYLPYIIQSGMFFYFGDRVYVESLNGKQILDYGHLIFDDETNDDHYYVFLDNPSQYGKKGPIKINSKRFIEINPGDNVRIVPESVYKKFNGIPNLNIRDKVTIARHKEFEHIFCFGDTPPEYIGRHGIISSVDYEDYTFKIEWVDHNFSMFQIDPKSIISHASQFKVGDEVIVRDNLTDLEKDASDVGWHKEKDIFLGTKHIIKEIDPSDGSCKFCDSKFWWDLKWLKPTTTTTKTKTKTKKQEDNTMSTKTTTNENNNDILSDIFGDKFGPIESDQFRLGIHGIAVKTPSGYRTYDPATDSLVKLVKSFTFGNEGMFFAMPDVSAVKGDIILVDGSPKCVIETSATRARVFDFEDSTIKEIVLAKHMINSIPYLFTKVVSPFAQITAGANTPNGMMNVLMLSSAMKGNKNKILPVLMLMNQQPGIPGVLGAGNQGMLNTLMMTSLFGGDDDSESDLKSLLPLMMMGGNGFNLFGGITQTSTEDTIPVK